ncbi:MAG: hypothetical protein KIT09_06460 [Bryobacteraceae bacterium]|nr:hypothetical protein [Bryobacteraceae bacterium]
MKLQLIACSLAAVTAGIAADVAPPTGEAASKKLEVQATLYNDKAAIRNLIGQDLGDGIIVVQVRVTPKADEPMKIWREDFFLRSDKDGQKSEPYEPSQIAGASVITLTRGQEGAPVMVQDQGPVWGGVGGAPRRLPGQGGGFGNATIGVERTDTQVGENSSEEQKKLLALLNEKVLPEGEISEPVTGLLYFPMEGKHKVKQLELHYRGEAAKLDLRFVKKNK